MTKVYYNYQNDFQNRNKFNDRIEGNNNVSYNAFLSVSSVDFYFKVNKRLETINLDMADIIPLGMSGIGLKSNTENVSRLSTNSVVINYNSTNNNQSITILS